MRNRMQTEAAMLRTLSVFMAWVVFVTSAKAAKEGPVVDADESRGSASKALTIKEQVARIPTGSRVEIRLANKEKLKGRIGSVSDNGIVLHPVKAGQGDERKIAFSEMESIKTTLSRGASIAGWAVAGYLIALGVAGALIVVLLATGHLLN